MRGFLRFLLGYIRVRIMVGDRELAINELRERRIDSWDYFLADDCFQLSTTAKGLMVLAERLSKEGIAYEKKGLRAFLWKNKKRSGLFLGAVASALIFLSFSAVVWDVRIEGNERVSSTQILRELNEAGLCVGASIRHLDRRDIAGDVLLSTEDLSFVRINLHGTVAHVTVRERELISEEEDGGFSNLVASADATVESLAVSSGNPLVHSGQVVKKGELLVSGITEGLHGNRLVRAEGEIFGRVSRTFSVSVPSTVMVSNEKYSKTTVFSLLFFGKRINIYRNTGNLPDNYATIYHSKPFYLGDSLKLPFGIERSDLHVYEQIKKTLTQEEQVRLAYLRLQEELILLLQDKELLSKKVEGRFDGEEYVLTCTLETLENIACTQEFSVN